MTYQNLEQIRAKNAIRHRNDAFPGADGGEVVKKVPTMIRENGILAAAAFAVESKGEGKGDKNPGHKKVFECIVEHLASKGIEKLPGKMSVEKFIFELSKSDSATMRDITAETMAYLNYLRRFARKKGESDYADDSR